MKGSWPKLKCAVTATFVADHSLPEIGVAARHSHNYTITAGWTHEINPWHGCTKPMQNMREDLDELVSQMSGQYLNGVFKFPPTAETMACWVMARLPAYWDFVRVECYDGYIVEVRADAMRSEWLEQYR